MSLHQWQDLTSTELAGLADDLGLGDLEELALVCHTNTTEVPSGNSIS